MKQLLKSAIQANSVAALVRLCVFLLSAIFYFRIAVPLNSWMFFGGPWGNVGYLDFNAPNVLDSQYSLIVTSAVIMELAFQSRNKLDAFWILGLAFAMFKIPMITLQFMAFRIYDGSIVEPLGKIMRLLVPSSFVILALTLTALLFPYCVGRIYRQLQSSGQVPTTQNIRLRQLPKLFALLVAPFLVTALIIAGSAMIIGIGAYLFYVVLVPWTMLVRGLAIVTFISLVALTLKSEKSFANWLVLFLAVIPATHYFLLIQFKEQYTNAISLFVFGGVVFVWLYFINRFLGEKALKA